MPPARLLCAHNFAFIAAGGLFWFVELLTSRLGLLFRREALLFGSWRCYGGSWRTFLARGGTFSFVALLWEFVAILFSFVALLFASWRTFARSWRHFLGATAASSNEKAGAKSSRPLFCDRVALFLDDGFGWRRKRPTRQREFATQIAVNHGLSALNLAAAFQFQRHLVVHARHELFLRAFNGQKCRFDAFFLRFERELGRHFDFGIGG